MTLIEGKVGKKYTVLSLSSEGKEKRRLLDLGFTPGTLVSITNIAPFGGTILVGLYGYMLALREKAAANIVVEEAAV